ncbi:MAG: hypothetical protein QM754_05275 [Tepidisphaeraceae bacterium]
MTPGRTTSRAGGRTTGQLNILDEFTRECLGWAPNNFRAYRCRVDYPMLGTGIDLHFDYPDTQSNKEPKPG